MRAVATVGVALLLASCGSSDPSAHPVVSSVPEADGAGTTTTIVVGPDGSSTVLSDAGDGAEPTTVTSLAAPHVGGGPASLDPSGPPGSFAPALLSPSGSSAIDVEVRSQSGAEPGQESIDHLASVLRTVSHKPVGTNGGATVAGGGHDWSADELRALVPSAPSPAGGRAQLTLLFVHGTLGGDKGVLGVAIRGDLAAIFIDRVNASATPLVGSSGIETAVVTHEVGHLLGLVDLYLHTGRQDPDHPGHSTDTHSVMYWAVESDLVADLLQGGPPREFDDADTADLATIRNGG